ncbi:hypothetical protein D3C80_2205900 [compost metagenome]
MHLEITSFPVLNNFSTPVSGYYFVMGLCIVLTLMDWLSEYHEEVASQKAGMFFEMAAASENTGGDEK